MKKVLIIAPDFVPSSLPPALRIRFFASHLTEFGWHPVIVTTEPKYYEHPIDPENERLLPSDLQMIRTKALPADFTRKFGIGDIGIRTLWHCSQVIKKLCRQEKINLVYLPVPPTVQAVLGRWIHQRFGIPYVIDYIDPWVTKHYWKLPQSQRPLKRTLSHLLACLLEPYTLRRVSHLVTVSKGTLDSVLERYSWLRESDVTEIPYGGEPQDFDYVRLNPRRNFSFNHKGDFFHISFVGRGGTDLKPGVRAVFEAIELGLRRSPNLFRRLRLHFIGTTYDPRPKGLTQISRWAETFSLQNYVDEHPQRISYLDAIQTLLDSHALLAVGSKFPHYTASKIFPYILARKPLLAVYREESTVVRILKKTKTGRLVTFGEEELTQDKVQEISKYLEEILSLPSDYIPPTSWEAFESYTARAMTERLAKVFDQVVSK